MYGSRIWQKILLPSLILSLVLEPLASSLAGWELVHAEEAASLGTIDVKYLTIDRNWEDKLGKPAPVIYADPQFVEKDRPALVKLEIDPDLCKRRHQEDSAAAAYCRDRAKDPALMVEPLIAPAIDVDQLPKAFRTESPSQQTWKDTKYVAGLAIVLVMAMTQMPEGVTNWNDSNFQGNLLQRSIDNDLTWPVFDHDKMAVNLIGHPLSGAMYYTIARKNGLGVGESFLYSFLMSTFLWEYGVEAAAEIPSIQDIIITPLLGSMVGEVAYQGIEWIDRHDGKILGSRFLGNITKVILAPLDSLVKGLQSVLDPVFGLVEMEAHVSLGHHHPSPFEPNNMAALSAQSEELWLRVSIPLPPGWDLRLLSNH